MNPEVLDIPKGYKFFQERASKVMRLWQEQPFDETRKSIIQILIEELESCYEVGFWDGHGSNKVTHIDNDHKIPLDESQ